MKITEKHFGKVLAFAQRLIQARSPSLGEGEAAEQIEREMRQLGYDEVWRDEVGNVIGTVEGRSDGPMIMLNGHMDTVGVSDLESWEHDPFEGYVDEKFLHGRGSADMKGSLAVMVYCGGLLKQLADDWAGRLVVAAVVLEEQGVGLGTRALLEKLKPDVAIVGEPTGNQLGIAHRGKGELVVLVRGKSCHASMPDKGINPLFSMSEFVRRLGRLEMASDELMGKSTLTPTLLRTDQASRNVIASQAELYLDWRRVPGQDPESLLGQLNEILRECLSDGASGEVRFLRFSGMCYTGKAVESETLTPCLNTEPKHPLVQIGRKVLSEALGREVELRTVSYASDCAHIAAKGTPTVLFGPGEPAMAHVRDERIELVQMREALEALPLLVVELFKQIKH